MKLTSYSLVVYCGLASIALSGCGKFLDKFGRLERSGLTNVTISRQASELTPGVIGFQSPLEMITNLSGGLIVYARNTDNGEVYSESLASVGSVGQLSLLLPNGNYEFSAVGWPTANLTGAPDPTTRVRCGIAPSKTLTGGSDSISIDLRNLDACYDNPDFVESFAKATSPEKSMLALNLVFCNQFTTITGKNDTSTCQNHESSGAFFNGDPTYTKVERVAYLSGTNSLFFTASHNSQLSSGYPTKPYELYKYDFDTGVQTKIGLSISAGFGITHIKAVPNRNKLLFIRDQDTTGTSVPRELWVYDDDLETLTEIDDVTIPSTRDGVKEFRVSEDGNWVVYVSDKAGPDLRHEVYSAPLDDYSPINSVSGSLTGNGVAYCGSCGDHGDSFYLQISPGTTNNYVLYSAENTVDDGYGAGVPGRYDLRISTVDGTDFSSANIHGSGPSTPPIMRGFRVSQTGASFINVANDKATYIGFSHDGTRVLYHAQTGGGTPVDKVFHISVSLSAGALTVANHTTVVSSDATYPYFKMGHTGTTTKKALVFSKDSGSSYQPLVSSVDLMSPGTVYPQFRIALNTGNFAQVYLTEDDGYVVAAAKDNSVFKVREIRSAPVTLSSWGGGSAGPGASVSHNITPGPLANTNEWINPIEGGDGDSSRVFTVNDTEDTILFLSSEGTDPPVHYRLYGSTIGSAGNSLLTHTDIDTAAESVTGAAFDTNGNKYFTADLDASGGPELYKVNLGQANKRDSLSSDTYMSKAISVVPQHDEDFEVFPDILPIMAAPKYVPGVKELWFFDPTDSSYTRASTLAGSHAADSNKGAGRAMVRIMKDRFDLGEAVAFQSDCLSLSASQLDGNWISSSVRIPTGIAGDTSPFHTVVDVFPGATDCNGSYRRHSFPNGLANYSSALGSDAKLAGDGLFDLLLFIRDP